MLEQPLHGGRGLVAAGNRGHARERLGVPARPSMARSPTRVFMRVERLSSSGSRASSAASASVGAQARKLEIGVGRTCRRRAPIATWVPARSGRLAPLGLRARDFHARLARAARA